MKVENGVLELDIMDLKPRHRDPRKYHITVDMLGKPARDVMATVERAYYSQIPGSWIGRVAVTKAAMPK